MYIDFLNLMCILIICSCIQIEPLNYRRGEEPKNDKPIPHEPLIPKPDEFGYNQFTPYNPLDVNLNPIDAPEEYKNKLLGKFVSTHAPIWYNLTNAFVDKISIHQPLPTQSYFDYSPNKLIEFFNVGHTVVFSNTLPTFKSLVISNRLLTDQMVVSGPVDYELIYHSKLDDLTDSDYIRICKDIQNAGLKLEMPKYEQLNKCEFYFDGMSEEMQKSVTVFKKLMRVSIWKPICKDGYKSLGFISTNTDTKPVSSGDFIGIFSTIYPTFCLKDEFVSEGRLSEKDTDYRDVDDNSGDKQEKLRIVKIIDPNKTWQQYDELSFFYVYKRPIDSETYNKIKVWVPNFNKFKIVD